MSSTPTQYATQLADLQQQFIDGTITLAAYKTALAGVIASYDSIGTLADQFREVRNLATEMLASISMINIKGTVPLVSDLPSGAENGDAYRIDNVSDPLIDGHLYVRIDGIWEDLKSISGPTGRSAYEIAVDLGFEGTEAEWIDFLAQPAIEAANLAIEKANLAEAQATAATEATTATEAKRTETEAVRAATEAVRAATESVRVDTVDAKNEALTAATAANLARDTASFKILSSTFAALDANKNFAANALAIVSDDPTPANNGTYVKLGASGAGSWSKVSSTGGLLFQTLSPDTGYLAAFVDSVGRASWLIRADGAMEIRKVVLPAGSVPATAVQDGTLTSAKFDALVTATLGRVAQVLDPESGYLWAVMDAGNHMALGIKVDGTVVIPKYSPILAASSITNTQLQDLTVTGAKVADGTLPLSKLAAALQALIPQSMSVSETGYVYAIVDSGNRMVFAIKADGSVLIPKFVIPDGSVTLAKLAPAVLTVMPQALAIETGYAWALVDSVGRIGLGVKLDGTVVGKMANSLLDGAVTTIKLAAGAVTESKLDPPIARLAVPHVGDVVEVPPDHWRAKLGSVAVRTEVSGSSWAQFPKYLTNALRGLNQSGVSLDFRRSSRLSIRGRRQGADWSPVATTTVESISAKGSTTDPASLSTSGRVLGDYFRYSSTSGTPTSFDGQSVVLGDLIVFDGTQFRVQKGPAPASSPTSRERGDWWVVTEAGTFDGVTYAAGDRIVCIGFDSQSGQGIMLWYKGKPSEGELFYRGEFDPASGLPASGVHGDLLQASAAGTISGEAYAVGDYIIYDTSTWGRVPTNPIVTVANGKMIPALGCIHSASEWEVRRTDKNNNRVGVTASARHQLSPRRSLDGIVCRSDSMFGVSAMQTNLSALVAPRQVVGIPRGGGTSDNVLSTMEYEIARGGDPYRGWFEFIWPGQNNQPTVVGDANWCRIIECDLRIAELLGVRDSRFAFLSVLGTMQMTWDAGESRVKIAQWEGMKAGTHILALLEQWYQANFPGQFVNTREVMLAKAAANTTPDPRTLGTMTEAQTAALYGWIPYSWMNKNTAYSFSLSSLNYVDWWNGSSTLPTGGADGDAYFRNGGTASIASGGVGNLIVRQGGIWAEYSPDIIHVGGGASQGGPQLAAALFDHLNNTKL